MPIPRVIEHPDAAAHLKRGFDQMARLMAITLGPTQGAILNYSTTKNRPEVLSDSATAARRVVAIPDRREDVGAMLLRQLIWRLQQRVGDGGATAAVLARAILHEATRMVTAGASMALVQSGIEKAVDCALSALRETAKPATNQEDLAAVAQAVTGHPEMSWIIGEMYDLLGPQAYITVENYVAPYLERVYFEGGRWGGKLISPYMVTAPATQKGIQKDCLVALYHGHLKTNEEVKPLLLLLGEQSPPHLLLVASEISGDALNLLVGAHSHPKSKANIVAVSLPAGGTTGLRNLQDLALLTGANVLSESMGQRLESVTLADLGKAKRVEADKEQLLVIRGGGESRAIREAIISLQTQLDEMESDDEDREMLQERLARLSGSAGILKVGTYTQAERSLLRQKAEQGLKSVAAAMEEGTVPGAGLAYVQAAQSIDPDVATSPDERFGMIAVKNALSAPFFQIMENAKISAPALILQDVLEAGPDYVYDVIRGEIRLAKEAAIVDAAKVNRVALEMAASGAKMALSVDVTILRKRPVTNVDYAP